MKKTIKHLASVILVALFLFIAFGSDDEDTTESNIAVEESEIVSDNSTNTKTKIDVCRCLTDPGNSDWSNQNKLACRDAISEEIGVQNWEKINFSKNPELNRKWDLLVEKCTGSKKVQTGIKEIDKNNELINEIGTSYGFIWEYIDIDTELYTTLAFDGLIFRQSAYLMNGKTNSEDFTKIIDISGKWSADDSKNAEGVIDGNNVYVSWVFSDDYSTLTNNKGVVFNRVKVK
jgi:hypothetical protein